MNSGSSLNNQNYNFASALVVEWSMLLFQDFHDIMIDPSCLNKWLLTFCKFREWVFKKHMKGFGSKITVKWEL